MEQLKVALNNLDSVLEQNAPNVSNRLQKGLTRNEINKLVRKFSWELPEDIFELYQWHDGLSVPIAQMSLVERLLRQKDKWHGELSGKDNEIHLNYQDRHLIAKFMPFEYALAGHRHLKLGRCMLDLLPVFVMSDGKTKYYCMLRLDEKTPSLFCADGTKAPPRGIDETFLSTQIKFTRLADFILLVSECVENAIKFDVGNTNNQTDNELLYALNSQQLEPICHKVGVQNI
jgi:hypothetical protein